MAYAESEKRHRKLVKKCWKKLRNKFEEILLEKDTLPRSISIPFYDKKTTQWVRLTLEISPLQNIFRKSGR